MNKALIMGNIGKDIELIQTNGGLSIAKTSVATTEKIGKDDQKKEVTTWHNIVAFGHQANHLHKRFNKGDKILIEGKISNTSYEKQDGTTGYKSEIIVDKMYFTGGAKKDSNTQETKVQTFAESELSIEDVPF